MTNTAQEFESEVKKAASMILAASYKASLAILDEIFSQRGAYQVAKSELGQREIAGVTLEDDYETGTRDCSAVRCPVIGP